MLNLDYDSKYDILNITLRDNCGSIGCEEYDGLVVMRDYATRTVMGLMIYGFADIYRKHSIPKFPEDVDISVDRDIVPIFLQKGVKL